MKNQFVFQICVCTLVLGSWSTPSLAQSPSPQRSRVQIVHIKPDMLNEFVDLQKNEVVPALKKGGVKSRTVYQTALFGNPTEYTIITPFDKFSEFDGVNPQLKALGAEANARLGEKIRKCVVSADSFVITRAADLSNPLDTNTPPPMIITTRVRVASGKMPDFENLFKTEITPAIKKAKIGLIVNQRGPGANPNEVSLTTPLTKYADLDLPSAPERALGREALTKIGPRFSAVATVIDIVVRRRVPELSF